MAHYGPERYWLPSGAVLASKPVRVFPRFSNVLAPLYSDPALTVSLPNPTSTDALGFLEFYAAPGDYWIFVNNMSFSETLIDADEDFWHASSEHVVAIPTDPWIIVHGMGCEPVVIIHDPFDNEMFADVTYIDNDTIRIEFGAPTAGAAHLRR